MKGIVFNLLEELIQREFSEETWDGLLEGAQLDGAYTSMGNYKDEEMLKLVEVASTTLKMPPQDIIRWFGRNALPLLAQKYPHFFDEHQSCRTFLLSLNDVIHAEVLKIYPGSNLPWFDYDTSSPDLLLMGYQSPRKLCALAHGFIEAAAAHYNEELTFEQRKCMNKGDEKCVFEISLRRLEA